MHCLDIPIIKVIKPIYSIFNVFHIDFNIKKRSIIKYK